MEHGQATGNFVGALALNLVGSALTSFSRSRRCRHRTFNGVAAVISFVGRSIGPWGVLTVVFGAAVIIPSMIALGLTLLAIIAS